MASYEWHDTFPYKDVYFTGMVRDKQRRKMSKSLGNSPDALGLIKEFGADGVRFGMLSCSPAGGDLLFDEKLCLQGRNFSNKIWNALKLLNHWDVDESLGQPVENALATAWIKNKYHQTLRQIDQKIEGYKLSEALIQLYSYIWDDYCSWYLEMIKPGYEQPIDATTLNEAKQVLKDICIILHPFMPFITEEVWSVLKDDADGDCIVATYPTVEDYDTALVDDLETVKSVVSSIRDTKNQHQINPKELLPLSIQTDEEATALFKRAGVTETVSKLGYLSDLKFVDEGEGYAFIVGKSKYYLKSNEELDIPAEIAKLEEELEYQKGFVNSVDKKLSNQGFVNNAPAKVVDMEKKKMADGQARILLIEEGLAKLRAELDS